MVMGAVMGAIGARTVAWETGESIAIARKGLKSAPGEKSGLSTASIVAMAVTGEDIIGGDER